MFSGRVYFPGQKLSAKSRKPHPISALQFRIPVKDISSKMFPSTNWLARQPNDRREERGIVGGIQKSKRGEGEREKGIGNGNRLPPSPFRQPSPLLHPLNRAQRRSRLVLRSLRCRIHAQQNNKGNLFTLAWLRFASGFLSLSLSLRFLCRLTDLTLSPFLSLSLSPSLPDCLRTITVGWVKAESGQANLCTGLRVYVLESTKRLESTISLCGALSSTLVWWWWETPRWKREGNIFREEMGKMYEADSQFEERTLILGGLLVTRTADRGKTGVDWDRAGGSAENFLSFG